jgi:glycosyltransferase involved in cell wall biosynthesis
LGSWALSSPLDKLEQSLTEALRKGLSAGEGLPALSQQLIDVDFSLGMHSRTGKYYIGKDIIDTPGLPIGKTFYWAHAASKTPRGLKKKLLGRLQNWQVMARTLGGPFLYLPVRSPGRPLLHLDPFTVPTTRLRRRDIVLCHDVGPVTHPDLFGPSMGRIYKAIYDAIARIGPHVVFVSRATQAEFMRLYPHANLASSQVIYPSVRAGITTDEETPIACLDAPFMLTVGSIGDRKNQARCIAAYARSRLWDEGVRYVLCGSKEPGHERATALAATTPGVVVLGYVSDAELNWLYRVAKGFVLASVLEGFGMPVSEAIARGQVPLVSKESVLHEVAGTGAITVDPRDEESIAIGMRSLVALNKAEHASRMERLRSSNERFSLDAVQQQWREAFACFTAAT